MKYRQIGDSGLRVSELCLGTMTFGSEYYNIAAVDQPLANDMVKRALERGVNFFDTADVYSFGESEKMLGTALENADVDREKVVIATKVKNAMSQTAKQGEGDVNNLGLSRKHIMEGCENSLRRLGVDYIDLYQVHAWDHNTPMEETMAALNDLVRQGMVRYIGCSNWSARHVMKSLYLAREKGWESFSSVQAYYSLACRDLEYEVQPLCEEEGLGILPWSPLAGGYLTGKFRRGQEDPEDARRSGYDFPPIDRETALDAVELMDGIAERQDASIPQVALRWLLTRGAVSSVIIGARTMEQLEDNLGTAEVTLTDEQVEELNDLTDPGSLYPGWMVERHDRPKSFEYTPE